MTHTFAELEVSAATYDEIEKLLKAAGYGHAFIPMEGGVAIDMHGIGLKRAAPADVSQSFGVQPRSARLGGENDSEG